MIDDQGVELPTHMHQKAGRYYYVKRDPVTKKLNSRLVCVAVNLALSTYGVRRIGPGKKSTNVVIGR